MATTFLSDRKKEKRESKVTFTKKSALIKSMKACGWSKVFKFMERRYFFSEQITSLDRFVVASIHVILRNLGTFYPII